MPPTILLLSILLASPVTTCESNFPDDLEIQAVWAGTNRHELQIGGNGSFTLSVLNSIDLLNGEGPTEASGCLSSGTIDQIAQEVESSGFFDFPVDLSAPPFVADEQMAFMSIQSSESAHSVRGSGLERAVTEQAVAFRELFCLSFVLTADELQASQPNSAFKWTPPAC